MLNTSASSKVNSIIKAVISAAILPVFFIYIMIDKPDYSLMNGLAHIVLPVANWTGHVITWPIRIVGDGITWVHDIATLKSENEELRAKLDAALMNKNSCDIAIKENQKLEKELDIYHASPFDAVIADIKFDNSAFHHNTFFINKGKESGIKNGMVVVSMDNRLVGIVTDSANNFARVKSLSDSGTNIAVRISGSEIYGFLQGNGKTKASMGFFSDPQFTARKGLKLITSNISGILPSGIYIGDMIDDTYVNILKPNNISRVMVLKFNNKDSYN